MNGFLAQSQFFISVISILFYFTAAKIQKKIKISIFNPYLVTVICIIGLLKILGLSYDVYKEGSKYLAYLLTPSTVALAIPLYEQIDYLKKYPAAILSGIVSGVLASAISILIFCIVFRFSHTEFVTLLPKSITTAIGMAMSEKLGGMVSLTVVSIAITGITGNVFAEQFLKLIGVTEPVAKGVAIGTSSHVLGTAKAVQLGEIEGAMSGLSIAVAGLMTVVVSILFSLVY